MFKRILILCLLLVVTLFGASAKKNYRTKLAVHNVVRKGITIPLEDSNFVQKYSKILGLPLDSCCHRKLIAEVASWLGTPYRAGGHTKAGTDCSGFVSSVYKEVFGISLSHSGVSMFHQMNHIVRKNEDLKEGDILFFRRRGNRITHVAMYLGKGKFIHSATVGRGVVVDDMHTPYYRYCYMFAGRVFPQGI